MSLEALIFDVDGTLAETERAGHRMAFNDAFAEFDLDWNWNDIVYGDLLTIGGGRERLTAWVDKEYLGRPEDREALIEKLYTRKVEQYKRRVREGHVDLRPGVARLIAEARAEGLLMAVATNSSIDSLSALTRKHFGGLPNEIFDVVITGEQLRQKKPDPHAYELAIEALGVSAENCIAFEDSSVGLQAARAVGIRTLVTVSTYTKAEDFSGAASVLSDLGEPENPAPELLQGQTEQSGPVSHVDIDWLRKLWASQHSE